MKRALSIILTAILISTLLISCGKAGKAGENESAAETAESSEAIKPDSEEEKPEESVAEPVEEEEEEEKEEDKGIKRPQGYVTRYYENVSLDASPGYYARSEYEIVNLSDESAKAYPQLDAALASFNNNRTSEIRKTMDYFAEELGVMYAESTPYSTAMYCNTHAYFDRVDEKVFSFTEYVEGYYGGVHGDYQYYGHTFDTRTGEEINLFDIIMDEYDLQAILVDNLRKYYPEVEDGSEPLAKKVERFVQKVPATNGENGEYWYEYNWVLDPEGITFYFNPYEIGPYAIGAQQVTLSFEDYPDLFMDKYKKCEGGFARYFDGGEDLRIDLNKDGSLEQINVYGEMNEYQFINKFHILINGFDYADDTWSEAFSFLPAVVRTADGKTYMYVTATGMNDYKETYVYSIDGPSVKPLGKVAGEVSDGIAYDNWYTDDGYRVGQMTDPSEFEFGTRADVLSTVDCSRKCRIDEKGLPASDYDYYNIHQRVELTMLKDAAFAEVKTDVDGKAEVTENMVDLKAGDTFRIIRTDRENWVDGRLPNGREVRINVESDENRWPRTVNGVEIMDLFEGMMFAG